MNLAIYGSGGLGRELLELALQINYKNHKWENIVFVVDDEYYNPQNNLINCARVIRWSEIISNSPSEIRFVIAQGEPLLRERIKQKIETSGFELENLIHPNVYIPESTMIGKGVVIQSGCFISCNVEIEDNVLVQINALIGHDCRLKTGCVISGLCNLAGGVTVGEYTYIGMSSCLREQITVGKKTIVSMYSGVFKDIKDEVIVIGNPARIMRRNEDHKVFK